MGRTLEIPVLEKQAEQIECDDDQAAARGGNRAGKSIGWGYWLFFKRLQVYPRAVHAVVGPDYDNLRRGFFPLFCGILDSLGWEEGIDYRYIASGAPRILLPYLHKHAKLHSISIKLAERLKGAAIQTLLLEEPQAWGTKEQSGRRGYEIIMTRLSHSQTSQTLYPDLKPQMRMSFNPPAEGTWLYTLIEEQWKKSGFRCWQMSVRENWLLAGREDYIRNLENTLDPQRQRSEIDGYWATGGGGVYYAFNPNIHGAPPDGIPAVDAVDYGEPLKWTWDFNVGEMCTLIAQVFRQTKIDDPQAIGGFRYGVPNWQPMVIRFLAEITQKNSSVPQIIEAFLASPWFTIAKEIEAKTGKPGIEICGDPSGGGRSVTADSRTSSRRPYEFIMSELRKAGLHPRQIWRRSAGSVKDGVFDMNAQMVSGVAPNHLYGMTVNVPACPRFVYDLRNLNWDAAGKDLAKKAGEIGDASDAARYLVTVERHPANVTWASVSTVRKS
ncbi:MAG TPA: hypothetical protein VFN49_03695 [Candidatus Aquilonibacter sp.]|nr:hypothetical protein [Candidatus Aquilonibacter sp.]